MINEQFLAGFPTFRRACLTFICIETDSTISATHKSSCCDGKTCRRFCRNNRSSRHGRSTSRLHSAEKAVAELARDTSTSDAPTDRETMALLSCLAIGTLLQK